MPIYSTVIVTPPEDEPVSVQELYDHLSLNARLEDVEDLLARSCTTARQMFEFHSGGRTVVSTEFDQFSPSWGRSCRPLELAQAGVTEVTSVKYYDADDSLVTLDSDDYGTDTTGTIGLVWMKDGSNWPGLSPHRPRPVVIRYTAGWDVDYVPQDVRTGILLLAAHYYRFRGDEDADIPDGFIRLANKYHTGSIVV